MAGTARCAAICVRLLRPNSDKLTPQPTARANQQGLATSWEQPQPSWSLFRSASFGFGVLTAEAETLSWAWRQNEALEGPPLADAFVIRKGESARGGGGVTRRAVLRA